MSPSDSSTPSIVIPNGLVSSLLLVSSFVSAGASTTSCPKLVVLSWLMTTRPDKPLTTMGAVSISLFAMFKSNCSVLRLSHPRRVSSLEASLMFSVLMLAEPLKAKGCCALVLIFPFRVSVPFSSCTFINCCR